MLARRLAPFLFYAWRLIGCGVPSTLLVSAIRINPAQQLPSQVGGRQSRRKSVAKTLPVALGEQGVSAKTLPVALGEQRVSVANVAPPEPDINLSAPQGVHFSTKCIVAICVFMAVSAFCGLVMMCSRDDEEEDKPVRDASDKSIRSASKQQVKSSKSLNAANSPDVPVPSEDVFASFQVGEDGQAPGNANDDTSSEEGDTFPKLGLPEENNENSQFEVSTSAVSGCDSSDDDDNVPRPTMTRSMTMPSPSYCPKGKGYTFNPVFSESDDSSTDEPGSADDQEIDQARPRCQTMAKTKKQAQARFKTMMF